MVEPQESLELLPESGYIRLEDLAKFVGVRKETLRRNLNPDCLIKCQIGCYLVALDRLLPKRAER